MTKDPTATRASFTVSDMTCNHCVATIREALAQALPGADVAIDLARHRVEVAAGADAAEAAIRAAGYTPQRLA